MTQLAYFWYGSPGIGKTVLVSGFVGGSPKQMPLYLYTSPCKYVRAYKKAIDGWPTFKKTVELLARKRPKIYSHIAVDVIDHIWTHCRDFVCDRHGIEHEGDMPHGKGWDLVKREFIPVVAKLVTLGYGVSFISHAKTIETRGRGITVKKIVPTIQNGGYQIVLPICDIEGYLGFSATDADDVEHSKTSGRRKIFFEPTETLDAKDWTSRLPRFIHTDPDPRVTCAELTAYLSGEKIAKKNRPVAKTPARTRVRRIRRASR
jgi:hypothetical protein